MNTYEVLGASILLLPLLLCVSGLIVYYLIDLRKKILSAQKYTLEDE
jgi:hypothetical protein